MATQLQKVKSNFKKWERLMLTFDDITWEIAHDLLKKYDIRIPRLVMPGVTHPLKLYRVRVFSPGNTEDISNPATFSYPPHKRVTNFQRANIPYNPVFYGAFDGKTAFEEVRINGNEVIKRGDIVFLSEWTVREGTSYNIAHLTLPEIAGDEQLFGDITKKVYSEITRIFKGESIAFAEEQSYLYQQASKIFLSGSYLQSGVLAHEILYKTPEVNGIKIDGILYPSCANNFRSVNCAFHPEFVDQFLKLESVRKLSFEEFTDQGAQTVGKYFGDIENEKIIWKSYFSELFVNTFTTEVELDEEWPENDIKTSKVLIEGKESEIEQYCEAIVQAIDLSKTPLQPEDSFRANKDFIFIYEQRFDPGVGFLKNNDRINQINVIRWKIPLKTSTKRVSTLEVMEIDSEM